MSQQAKHFYEFGGFRIDVKKRRLLRDGEIVPLAPKVFDLLLTLAEQGGKTLEKDELMRTLWPDTVVEENNLTQNVYTLRKVFGEGRKDNRFIATVPGIGYRFVAKVKEISFDEDEVAVRESIEARITIAEVDEGDAVEVESSAAGGSQVDREPASGSQVDPVASSFPQAADALSLMLAATATRRIDNRFVVGLVVAVLGMSAAAYFLARSSPSTGSNDAFRGLTINQLTRTGTAQRVAISPDGRNVVYSVRESDRESLWLRQVATGSTQEIVPPDETNYFCVNFSHDGNYLYFVSRKPGAYDNVIYKMPALGGIPAKLAAGMESAISISPDDRKIALIRNSESESALIVANSDGSDEHRLAVRPITDEFKVPAWSPDGKTIAVTTGSGEAYDGQNGVVGVGVEDGKEKPLTAQKWFWTRWVEWLPNGSGVLVTAKDADSHPAQIWYVSYPSGEVRRITNDSKEYVNVSVAADSRTVVATQTELLSEIWLASLGDAARPRKLTFGTGTYGDVIFSADGAIIYSSQESGNMDIWRINADGTDKRQLTSDPRVDMHQAVSPDGRYIVFASNRAGNFNIWRMESDGTNPVRLTAGQGEKFPRCSPDGQWVIYNVVSSNERLYSLWKVPLQGGEPVWLADQANDASISPDGKHIAYFSHDPRPAYQHKVVVIPFEGGRPERTFDLPVDIPLIPTARWAPDGKALLYAATIGGVSDIFMQPLDGTPPKKLTDFKFEGRLLFDLSPDGKRIVMTRRLWTFDVLLLTNFR